MWLVSGKNRFGSPDLPTTAGASHRDGPKEGRPTSLTGGHAGAGDAALVGSSLRPPRWGRPPAQWPAHACTPYSVPTKFCPDRLFSATRSRALPTSSRASHQQRLSASSSSRLSPQPAPRHLRIIRYPIACRRSAYLSLLSRSLAARRPRAFSPRQNRDRRALLPLPASSVFA